MPPQPLHSVRPKAKVTVDHVGITDRPELAQLLGTAIAIWAHVESSLAGLLAGILGGKPAETPIAMYSALTSTASQYAALRAAADTALHDSDSKKLFEAIYHLVTRNSNARHKFAHWLWATSDELVDALLLVDPRAAIAHKMDMVGALSSADTLSEVLSLTIPEMDRRRVWVYRKPEFEEVITNFTEIRFSRAATCAVSL
jgi:L-alanine-DL-glutamate epimerase-like enolase superfamily enzyme